MKEYKLTKTNPQQEIVMKFCENCKEVTQTYQIINNKAGLKLYSCTKCGCGDSVVIDKKASDLFY